MLKITHVGAKAGETIVLRIETDDEITVTPNDEKPIMLGPDTKLEIKMMESSALVLRFSHGEPK